MIKWGYTTLSIAPFFFMFIQYGLLFIIDILRVQLVNSVLIL